MMCIIALDSLGMSQTSKKKGKKVAQPSSQPWVPPQVPPAPDLPSQRSQQTRWGQPMMDILLDVLSDEVTKCGRRADNGFKADTYQLVANAVNAKLGMTINSENVRSRMKTLKKEYAVAKRLLEVSGFGWDSVNKTIVNADANAWAAYIAANLAAKNFNGKVLPFYDQLRFLVGDDCANGDENYTAQDVDSPGHHQPVYEGLKLCYNYARAAAIPPARPTPAAARTPQPCTCRLCREGSPHSSSSSHSSYASSSSLYGSSSSSSSSDGSSVIEVDCTGQPIDYENEDYDPVEEWDQFGNLIVVVG
ncbi:Myb/SANT-like DNA-binding domain protein [Thalictrum thalictroides]|uniref:Myb/SANT-like DNA-binding domain protein n=1 Tax=Thalictrum thalictroides TaxID=46969 RepID=A0A7J6UXC1_THATH|nr:Myb/SANT-like DNA-binding domain protein [Thalictrum thalictroides]